MVSFGVFQLDTVDERLSKAGKPVAIRRKPFAILRYLAENPRRLVTQEELLEHVWGGLAVSESAVRTQVHDLRQLVGEGVIETVIGRGYRFIAELTTDTVPVPATPDRPLVGRENELDVLRAALRRALAGQRQVAFVTGEPGIGKTTLTETFVDELEVTAVRGHCIEQHGAPEAYLAVIEAITALRASPLGDRILAALIRHAPVFLAEVPRLVPDERRAEIHQRAGAGGEARMMRELIEALEAVAAIDPIVIVLEDLQWSDVATLDWLAMLGQRKERAKLLVIATSRQAEAQTVTHPLNRVMRTLLARSSAIAIPLSQFGGTDVRKLVDARFPGHAFPDEMSEIITRITGGTPLFVASFLDSLIERELIQQREGRWELGATLDAIAKLRPDSVKQLIDIQLDRATIPEQRVLEAASMIGAQSPTGLVAAALGMSAIDVDDLCDGLARRSLFLRRDGTEEWPDGRVHTRYAVTHGLVQEVCAERSAPGRRQAWHRAIAQELERGYGERAGEVAQALARHYDEGGQPERAAQHYAVAAERTMKRFASSDAVALLERGLALVPRIPASKDLDALELRLLGVYTSAMLRTAPQTQGSPMVVLARLIAAAERAGDAGRACASIVNISVRLARYDEALAVSDRLDEIAATSVVSQDLRDFVSMARMMACFWLARIPEALALEARLSDITFGDADGLGFGGPDGVQAIRLGYSGALQWVIGRPLVGLQEARRALEFAQRAGDTYMIGYAACALGFLLHRHGEPGESLRELAELTFATRGESFRLQAEILSAVSAPADAATLDGILEGFRARTTALPMSSTSIAIPLADALHRAGRDRDARELIEEMIVFAREHNEVLYEPELLRLRGELDPARAAAAFREAHAIAERHGTALLALRAALAIATIEPGPGLDLVRAALEKIEEPAGADVERARALVG